MKNYSGNILELRDMVYPMCKIRIEEIVPRRWTRETYNDVRNGGYGGMAELLIKRCLVEDFGYNNIKFSNVNALSDISLTNEPTKKVDLRMVSQKNTMCIAHTSGTLSRKKWEEKARILMDGGYIGIRLLDDHISLFYVSARRLLEYPKEFKNTITLIQLYRCFGVNLFD